MAIDLKNLGKRLKLLREENGFNQQSIAQYLAVDQSLVSKWEAGERMLAADKLELLASLYGVTMQNFLAETVPPKAIVVAFRSKELDCSDLQAIAAVKRIMLNQEALEALMGGSVDVKE